ncbi:MAG TPA: glycosyltransferase family 87 protein [Solirubrobacteraceae bacterium]
MEINDLYVYSVFNDLLGDDKVPYRDFGFEYPPLALVPIALPDLLGGSYETWFAIAMLVCALACQELLRALAGPLAAWAWVAMPLALGAQVRTHFDLAAIALVLGALLAYARERPRAAFVLLGVGTLVKLFPLVLAPVAASWLWGRGRGTAARDGLLLCAGVVVAGFLPFVVLGGVDDMFRFHLERPVQIESLAASALFALGGSYVTGAPVRPDAFKSNGLDGGHADLVLALSTVALVAVLVLAIVVAARATSERHLIRCALLALLAFVTFGKVLSPQYMIWLAPFAVLALTAGDRAVAGLLVAAIVLTQVWFPSRYFDLVGEDGNIVALVAVRNLLLLAALVAVASRATRSRRPAAR